MTRKRPERLRLDRLATPIGEALLLTDEDGHLRALDWADRESGMARLLRLHYGPIVPEQGIAPDQVRRSLRDYFEGDLGCLTALGWRTAGTPFQRAVWTALVAIAPGETLTYGALANGANPISVVVPCHRVIGADGSLTGYGGGIERKRWLLRHEGTPFGTDGLTLQLHFHRMPRIFV